MQVQDAKPSQETQARLDRLLLCRRSLQTYYESLSEDPDPLLNTAAIAALLEIGSLKRELWPRAIELSRRGIVRERAFRFFMALREYGLVGDVLSRTPRNQTELLHDRMSAELHLDYRLLKELDAELFLETGDIVHLQNARASAERDSGWQAALPYALQALFAHPANPDGPFAVLTLLVEAIQWEMVRAITATFTLGGLYPAETAVFMAAARLAEGNPKAALKQLQSVSLKGLPNPLTARALKVTAEAFEELGDNAQAYAAYGRLNAVDKNPTVVAERFSAGVLQRARLTFEGPPPEDSREATCFMMLGFPRSGTTLLENALAAHPGVETFEEIPAIQSAREYVERNVQAPGPVPEDVAGIARDRYFAELTRWRRKSTASVLVDKLPISSADGVFLSKLFPGRRYLFSVRHPYDVVLSCFKQIFAPNDAMENFRTLSNACKLYDFAMRQWFSVFALEDERVHYIRYDDLVNHFQPTVTSALNFLGVDWDNSVLDFAALAGDRAARTPSYPKVRAGLSAGVQTSRKKYLGFFTTEDRKFLDPWVRWFSYDG